MLMRRGSKCCRYNLSTHPHVPLPCDARDARGGVVVAVHDWVESAIHFTPHPDVREAWKAAWTCVHQIGLNTANMAPVCTLRMC